MTKSYIIHLVIAFVFGFTLCTATRAMAQATPAGSVTALTGDVHIERGGTVVPATPSTAVDVGDRIVSGPNSRATITLTDNSKLELDESSSLVHRPADGRSQHAQHEAEPLLRLGAFFRIVLVVTDAEFRGAYT